MWIKLTPIPLENLNKMKEFQYKSTDESFLYNKCLSPCLNKVIEIFPIWSAPNIITLFSLLMNIIASIITYIDSQFDFSKQLNPITCIIIGITQFLYLILDNLDGKQARRTGSSSPYGMLVDHGCDIFTNCFTCFNLSHLTLIGNDNFLSISIFCGLILGFYSMTYEEYIIGELHFPVINATDEGNLVVSLFGFFCGIFGQNWLKTKIYFHISFSKIIGIISLLGGISCVYNLFLHTYKQKSLVDCFKIFLDWIYFYIVLVFPIIVFIFRKRFYINYKGIIFICMCLLFARITMDLQIRIVTEDIIKGNFFIILVSVLLLVSLYFSREKDILFCLCCIAYFQIIELSMFIYQRSMQITTFLEIKIFKINPSIQI